MSDADVLTRIQQMVQSEHELRASLQHGAADEEEVKGRLRAIEVALDQCWDLLRQRRARAEFHDDPDAAQERPAQEVEGYIQ